ncbi:MAG: hypothetical protein ACK4SU_02060 [Dictyoglomus sp.]
MTIGGVIVFIELINIFLASVNNLPNILASYGKAKVAKRRLG